MVGTIKEEEEDDEVLEFIDLKEKKGMKLLSSNQKETLAGQAKKEDSPKKGGG